MTVEPPSPQQTPPRGPYFLNRTDSTCRAELQHAQADAQQGQLTYFLFQKARYAADLDTLLHGHGIRFRYNPMNCTQQERCYAHYMDSVITRLHGPAFLERIKQATSQRFVSAWRTRTYREWDLDVPPHGGIQDLDAYVTANLPRPQGWDTRPKLGMFQGIAERQFLFAALTVERSGQLGEISFPADMPSNVNATNRRYLPSVKQEIRRLLRAAGPWQAGRLAGQRVSATLYVDVTLNPEQMP
ncbi:hypothetical protein GCM10027511_31210 [Hymenobacter humi]